MHIGSQAGERQPGQARRSIFAAEAETPDAWRLGDQSGGFGKNVGPHLLEGPGQVGKLQRQMITDRAALDHLLGDAPGIGIGIGLGAVAFFTGLGLGFVEIIVPKRAEETRRRGLRDARQRGQFGGGVGFYKCLILKQQRCKFLL